jgi:hypothetical protein
VPLYLCENWRCGHDLPTFVQQDRLTLNQLQEKLDTTLEVFYELAIRRSCTKVNALHSEGPYRQYKSPTSLKQYLWYVLGEDKHKEVSVQTISGCLNIVCLTLNNSAHRWHSNHFNTFWGSSISGEGTFILLVTCYAFLPGKNFIYLILFKNPVLTTQQSLRFKKYFVR